MPFSFPSRARLSAPVNETTYTNGKVQSGQSYTYQVQSLSVFKQGLVEGGLSDTASATSQGREALRRPEPPQAVITDTGVKVFWNHAQTGNLAGYRIYRRAAGETNTRKIGEVNLPYNMYIDKSAPKGVALYYSVSSVDSHAMRILAIAVRSYPYSTGSFGAVNNCRRM